MKPRKPETIARAVIAGFLVAICGPVELVGATPPLDEQLAAARRAGDRLAELEVLEKMAAARPGDDSLLAALARGWLVEGDAASAARALDRMKSPPAELRALVEARRLAADQPEAARRILEEAVAANPGSIALWEALVDLLAGMGEPGQAVALLARAPAARDNPSLGLREARARRAAGDYRGAIEVFRSLPAADAEIQRAAPEFERLEATMPGYEHAWLRQLRRDRLDAFVASGLPARRDEAWRYTPLK
ncbi:MAG: tetratricopeptide repeat protein, partial [Terrimicrobiaceae bacterium]|nr:tetratricopeptide repeat protein [Terrimicrobiaceae bacterium]